MALKKRPVYHTPGWYYDHCSAENGGSPNFRAMLKHDMAFIGADNDSHLCYQEKIETYEETWNRVFSKWRLEDPNGVLLPEMVKAMEREALKGYKPREGQRLQVEVAKKPEAGGTAQNEAREKLRRAMKRNPFFE